MPGEHHALRPSPDRWADTARAVGEGIALESSGLRRIRSLLLRMLTMWQQCDPTCRIGAPAQVPVCAPYR